MHKYSIIFSACAAFLWITAGMGNASVISAEKVRSSIIEHLQKRAEEAGLEIETTVPKAVDINLKETDESVMRIIVSDDRKLEARVPVRLEFRNAAGEIVKRFQITAQVKVFKTVAVASCKKTRGDNILPGDFEMKRMDVSGLKDYLSEPSMLESIQAKRSIRAGTILTQGNVSAIPVIKRDRVSIHVRIGNIKASAEGTARQAGGKGETIKVYNEMTRTTLECVVIDKRTVKTGM